MSPATMRPAALDRAMELLRAEVARTDLSKTARRLGYSRPAVSMVVAGTYAGRPDRLLERVLDVLGTHQCPHLGAEIAHRTCAEHHSRPMPTGSRSAFRHWQACRRCAHRTQGGQAC